MRNASHTKSGPGRKHNAEPSDRSLRSGESIGSKLMRQMQRGVFGQLSQAK